MEKTKKVSFTESVKEGAQLYFNNLALIIIIDLISLIPYAVTHYLAAAGKASGSFIIPAMLINAFLMLVNNGALYTLFHKSYNGIKIGFSEAFMAGVKVSGKLLLVGFLVTAAIMAGSFLLIIPGIILAFKYWFAVIAVIVEDKEIGPLKLSSHLSKGNAGIIFLTMLLFVLVSVFTPFIYRLAPVNAFLFFPLMIIFNLLSTIVQSIQYITYAKIRASKADEISPDKIKAIDSGAGCAITAALIIFLTAAGIIAAVFVTKSIGFNKILKAIYGNTAVLSEDINLQMNENWYFIKLPPGHYSYTVIRHNETGKQGIYAAMIRSIELTEVEKTLPEDSGVINSPLKLIQALEARINNGNESNSIPAKWNLDEKIKILPVMVNGTKWSKAVVPNADESTGTKWNVFFTMEKDRLIYLFYRTAFDKTDIKTYTEDEKELFSLFEIKK